nr:MAG TPA: hypothetical protein [Caudoviricetes sp.]
MSKQRSFYCYQSIRLGGRFSVEYIITSVTVFQDRFRIVSYGFLVF